MIIFLNNYCRSLEVFLHITHWNAVVFGWIEQMLLNKTFGASKRQMRSCITYKWENIKIKCKCWCWLKQKNISQKIRRFNNSFLSISEFKSYSHIFLCREQWWGRLHNEPTFVLSNRPFDLSSSRQPPMMKRDMINLMQVYKRTLKSLNASHSIELSNLGLEFTNLSIL